MDWEIIAGGLTMLIMLLGVGGMVAIIKWSNWKFDPRHAQLARKLSALPEAPSQDARVKALEIYRQLASEKLDIVKTAVAMGYKDKELDLLDQRLGELIGEDALKELIRGEAPLAGGKLRERDTESELRKLRGVVEG